MPTRQKVIIYLIGVVLGLIILSIIPRQSREGREHPWHAQTAPEGYYPLQTEDYWKRPITLERQPRYFVSLAPSVTEVLFAMDMGDHLISVTRWCDYPERAREMRDAGAHIGDMDKPDRESIIEYRPDLVLGSQHTPKDTYEALHRPPGTIAIGLSFETLEDIHQSIAEIGRVAGVPQHALRLIKQLRDRENTIRENLEPWQNERPRRTLFLLNIEEGLQPGWTAGSHTWIDDIIRMAHAENISSDISRSWGTLQFEALVDLDPEVILIKEGSSPAEKAALDRALERIGHHPIWQTTSAVRNQRIYRIPAEHINIPGPRTWDALEAFAAAIWDSNRP